MEKEIELLPKFCKSYEQALESAKTSVISCLSLTRPVSVDDIRFAAERGFKWGYKYSRKEKFDIWLVCDVDITNKETALRAVTTSKEKAEKYKKSIEKSHRFFGNKQFIVDIEPRDANHLYGITVLESIGVELKKDKQRS